MALQILNPQRSFGEELGRSLSSGLSRLADSKLQQLHFSDALKQSNYSDAQIALLNQLPANQRLEALQSLSPAGRGQQQLSQQMQQQQQPDSQAAGLMERMQGLGGQPQQLSQQEAMQAFNDNKLNQMGLGGQQKQGAGPSADVQTLLNEAARQGMTLTDEQKQKIGRKVQEIYSDQGKRKALEDDVMKYVAQQQGQQQQAQGQAQPALQGQDQNRPIFKKPLSTTDKIAQEGLEIKKRKEEREAFKDIKPFLDEQAKDFKNASSIYEVATRALSNVQKNKGKWPTIRGYIPEKLHRDPDVRNYIRDLNKIVDLSSESIKGNATNYKVALKRSTKVDLTEPIESQIQGLKDIIAGSKKVFDTQDTIDKTLASSPDRFPVDLAQKITKEIGRPDQRYTVGQVVDELPNAADYPGMEGEYNGKKIKSVDGKWVNVK